MRERRTRRAFLTAASLLGALAGVAVAAATGAALAQQGAPSSAPASLEVSHVPPLLTADGDPGELRYDVYCVDDRDPEEACVVDGAVFVRALSGGRFQRIAVRHEAGAPEGAYAATLPEEIARGRAGFEYYAVFRSERVAEPVTLPAAGELAPQRSLPLARSVMVDLGEHVFGESLPARERVVAAAWGDGPGEVGLELSRHLPPAGGSSFDVGEDGTVHVLDEANRRLLRWRRGSSEPAHVPLDVNGTIADLAVADDGTAYVLETTRGADGTGPLLRAFAADGSSRGATEIAERAAQVRIGPEGAPFVLQHPSSQWMSAAAGGRLLGGRAQRATGRAGRPLRGGGEMLVLRYGNELRLAIMGTSGVRRSWRIASRTPLAEVQLAEPYEGGIVAVVRAYSDAADEFLVLVLGGRGLERRFAVDPADWAETAPLSRFRLVGSSLYRLGSSPSGLFVDRIDLEVKR